MKQGLINLIRRFDIYRLSRALPADRRTLLRQIASRTALDFLRLKALTDAIDTLDAKDVRGSIVCCGVRRGGAAALLAILGTKTRRWTWIFDAFMGFQEGESEELAELTRIISSATKGGGVVSMRGGSTTQFSLEHFLFEQLRLSRDHIRVIPGWLADILPQWRNDIGSIALLHINTDWAVPTKAALEALFENIVRGGTIIIDDYGTAGSCKKAVDDFLATHSLPAPIPIAAGAVQIEKR